MATRRSNKDAKYADFVREDRGLPTRWQDRPDQTYGGWRPTQLGAGEDLYWGDPTWDPTYYGDERDSYLISGPRDEGAGQFGPNVSLNWDEMPALERGVKGNEQKWLHDDSIEFDENGKPSIKKGYTWAMGGAYDPSAVYWDPNYGWYTSNENWGSGSLGRTLGSLMMIAFSGPMWEGIWGQLVDKFPLLGQLATTAEGWWDTLTAPFDEFVEGFTNAIEKGWDEVTKYLESVGLDPNGLEISSDAARSLGLDKDLALDKITPSGPNGGYTLSDIAKITPGGPNVIDPWPEGWPEHDPNAETPWDYAREPWPDTTDAGTPATGGEVENVVRTFPTINSDGTGGVTHFPNWATDAAAAATTTGAAKTIWDRAKDIWDAGGTIDDVLDIIRDVAPGVLQYLSAEDFEDWLNGYMTDESLRKKLDPFGDQRAGYQDRLRQVVENPEEFFKNDPGYRFLQNEGLRAAQMSAGPGGRYGSSNAAQWAQDRALGTAATQRFNEIAALSPLAGAQFGPESYAGLYRDAFKAAGEARKGMYTGINQAVSGALGENTRRGTGQGGNANLVTTGIDLAKGLYDTIFGN